jgi:hypothetical protein
MHLRTYVDINYFDCLHVRNSFLNLYRVFLKHPVYEQILGNSRIQTL